MINVTDKRGTTAVAALLAFTLTLTLPIEAVV